ncbi:MAG: hypothetical protein ACK5NF_06890 [Bacilli bacterium]
MNEVIRSFTNFLKKKETVTVLGVILIFIVFYFGYNNRINSVIKPVKIPVAAVDIQPKTKITNDLIKWIEVPQKYVQSLDIYYNSKTLTDGMYSNYNTMISQGNMFYKSSVVAGEDLPSYFTLFLEKGETFTYFPVTTATTYGNKIMPGDTIDMYFQYVDDDGKMKIGKLFENIKVLDVHDKQGNPVFENTDEVRIPAYLLFASDIETQLLFRRGTYLSLLGASFIPGLTSESYNENPSSFRVSSEQIQNYIDSKTQAIPVDELPDVGTGIDEVEDNENDNNSDLITEE